MPVRSDPQTATAKWVSNLSNSTQAMTRGVQAVTVAPGIAAANAADKWLQNVTAAKDKFASRVRSVSLSDWQNAMTSYGINRVSQGATAKQAKMQSFMTEFLPHLKTGVQQVEAMPHMNLEDGINRAVAMIRHNAQFKRKGA
jgi:hypothetical protein